MKRLMDKETYLKENFVKDWGFCKQYKTVKSCLIASLGKQLIYFEKDLYFYDGLPENIGYKQTTKDRELPLFAPNQLKELIT